MALPRNLYDRAQRAFRDAEINSDTAFNVMSEDFKQAVARGIVDGVTLVHKFGRNEIGNTLTPITSSGFYRTPTAGVTIAAISNNANDTANGTGARTIKVEYIDSIDFTAKMATISMNGTTETTDTIPNVYRLTRSFLTESGTYATSTNSSHAGIITLREAGGGQTWAQIDVDGTIGLGQSLIGAYTVPAGKTAYILSQFISIESGKSADIYFFKRENIDDVTAPFSPLRVQNVFVGSGGAFEYLHSTFEEYPEKTDIGYMGKVATGTSGVSVEFELLLFDNL